MSKIKVEDLPGFNILDSFNSIEDIKDWMQISINEDKTIEDFEQSANTLIAAIDKIKKLN